MAADYVIRHFDRLHRSLVAGEVSLSGSLILMDYMNVYFRVKLLF